MSGAERWDYPGAFLYITTQAESRTPSQPTLWGYTVVSGGGSQGTTCAPGVLDSASRTFYVPQSLSEVAQGHQLDVDDHHE